MTTTTKKHTSTNREARAILETLKITQIKPRRSCGGSWVIGTIASHRFEALIFPEQPELPEFALGDSRISKLWLWNADNGATAAEFDRGWVRRATTPNAVAIVAVLAAGLAEHVFGR